MLLGEKKALRLKIGCCLKKKEEEIRYGYANKSRSALFQSLAPSGRRAPCAPKQRLLEGASPELRVHLSLSAPLTTMVIITSICIEKMNF